MKLLDCHLTVFDTETTGIDTSKDRVVEFGAVSRIGGPYVAKIEHHRYIHPQIPIPAEATSVHGITDTKVANELPFHEVAGDLARVFQQAEVLVGYNAMSYDAAILNAEFERASHPYRIDLSKVLDPVIFVRHHFRHLRSRKLGDMCAFLGVVLDHAHSAVADSQATLDLLLELVRRKTIPEDVDEALRFQWHFSKIQEREQAHWTYWLYEDREDGQLRLGAGKHCGTLLKEVDVGFLRWAVNKLNDLHPNVRECFEREIRCREGYRPMSATALLRGRK